METLSDLGTETVDLVVIAGDADETRSENLCAKNLRWLQISGNEDPGVEALPGGLGGDGIGEIPRGRATDGLESKGLGLRQSHGNDAVFERERGEIDGVILDV